MTIQVIHKFEDYTLNETRLTLFHGAEEVRLEPQVLRLLILLVKNADRVVTKDEINAEVWNGRVVSDASLASRLRATRSAIGDNGSAQRLIRTIPNVGVRFVGEVTTTETGQTQRGHPFIAFVRNYALILSGGVVAALGLAVLGWHFGIAAPNEALRAQFEKTPDAAIRLYNHKKFRDVTPEQCMRECLKMEEFTCRSFDYYKRLAVCDLSAATAESVGGLKTDYELDPYDHYARKDYPAGPIEMGRDDTLDLVNPEPYSDYGVE